MRCLEHDFKKRLCYVFATIFFSYAINLILPQIFYTPVYSNEPIYKFLCLIINSLLSAIPFGVLLNKMEFFEWDSQNKGSPPFNIKIHFILVGLLLILITGILYAIITVFLNYAGIRFKQFELPELNNTLYIILAIFCYAVIPAICEEFIFRGVIFRLLAHINIVVAMVISSGIFAMLHGNFAQSFLAFIAGMYFCFMYIKLGSIWPSIVLHFLNNLLNFVLEFFHKSSNNQVFHTVDLVLQLLIVILGVFSLFRLIKISGKDFIKVPINARISSGTCYYITLKCWFTVLFILFYLFILRINTI